MFIGPTMFDEAFMYELGDVRYFDSSLSGPKSLKWIQLDFFSFLWLWLESGISITKFCDQGEKVM